MIKWARFVFYSVLVWYIGTERPTLPALTAGMITIVLLGLNVLAVAFAANVLVYPHHLVVFEPARLIGLRAYLIAGLVTTGAGAVMASYWAPGGDTVRLEQEFGAVTEGKRRSRRRVLLIYVILSFFGPELLGLMYHFFIRA